MSKYKNWNLGLAVGVLLFVANYYFILLPLHESKIHARVQIQGLKDQLQFAMHNVQPISQLAIVRDKDWRKDLEDFLHTSNVKLTDFNIIALDKNNHAIELSLQGEDNEMNVDAFLLDLITGSLPFVIQKSEIKMNAAGLLSFKLNVLLIKDVLFKQPSLLLNAQQPLFCHPLTQRWLLEQISLSNLIFAGYIAQANRSEALVASGNQFFNLDVGDSVGEEKARVLQVTPQEISLELPNHSIKLLKMTI